VKNNLEIVPVRWIDRVLEVALERVPPPLPDDEPVAVVPAVAAAEVPTPPGATDTRPH